MKPKPMISCKNCSHVCAYHCAQQWYTTQQTAVLIFSSPHNLQV